MARTKINTLRHLLPAPRSLSIGEFKRRSAHGRAAYGALFDELAEEDDDLTLAAPEPVRTLPRTRPPSSPPAPLPSLAPPSDGFRRLMPVQRLEDLGAWTRAAAGIGISPDLAEDALAGRRELWARGRTLESLESVGFTFEGIETLRVPNVGDELSVN